MPLVLPVELVAKILHCLSIEDKWKSRQLNRWIKHIMEADLYKAGCLQLTSTELASVYSRQDLPMFDLSRNDILIIRRLREPAPVLKFSVTMLVTLFPGYNGTLAYDQDWSSIYSIIQRPAFTLWLRFVSMQTYRFHASDLEAFGRIICVPALHNAVKCRHPMFSCIGPEESLACNILEGIFSLGDIYNFAMFDTIERVRRKYIECIES